MFCVCFVFVCVVCPVFLQMCEGFPVQGWHGTTTEYPPSFLSFIISVKPPATFSSLLSLFRVLVCFCGPRARLNKYALNLHTFLLGTVSFVAGGGGGGAVPVCLQQTRTPAARGFCSRTPPCGTTPASSGGGGRRTTTMRSPSTWRTLARCRRPRWRTGMGTSSG